ncbi:hypothetical protein JG687_00010715 [Phytophthora cactorum]|uniref:Uncharacterized protein n=1 Tax=Phytophthora cactorum TaxID=29920 RepID=A0A8T1U6I9_9STRA|nr:hypothetical protein JG687_00010715 [Phytophthora cactorum]
MMKMSGRNYSNDLVLTWRLYLQVYLRSCKYFANLVLLPSFTQGLLERAATSDSHVFYLFLCNSKPASF